MTVKECDHKNKLIYATMDWGNSDGTQNTEWKCEDCGQRGFYVHDIDLRGKIRDCMLIGGPDAKRTQDPD
jgi:hypothetical protein